ncbi:MAG: methyltransferase family protein [Planctomycetota bacterium]|nr:methyltransferase family protein [Planctomycetota bacterium]
MTRSTRMPNPPSEETKAQGRYWSRHASKYDEVFLDPFRPGVVNPIPEAIRAIPGTKTKSAIDLGCGTGPLLPLLVEQFGEVHALDFASAMIRCSKDRLGADADRVTWHNRTMDDLGDLVAQFDVAVAINSLVMPDVRDVDRTLNAVRAALKPGGVFFGVVPSIDAIHYHTMLLLDRELDKGLDPVEAERLAAHHGEHRYYEFGFSRFQFQGLRQKFWQPFEIEYRLKRAGFSRVVLDRVLYPWDDHLPSGEAFADYPPSWDWSFTARL